MTATELRLNNYVLEGGQVVLLSTNYDLFKCLVNVGRGIGFEPIPLTEEWLLMFGFELSPNGKYDILAGKILIQYDVNNKWVDFVKRVNFDTFIPIEYVHQIQNLYFALTGEELTINNK